MVKVKTSLLVAVQDPNYLELLSNYVRSSEFGQTFSIKSFSRKESLEQYLHNQPADILLIEPDMLTDQPPINKARCIVLLKELLDDIDGPYLSVQKYQPLNQLLSMVWSVFIQSVDTSFKNLPKHRSASVLSIYSASGGTGKTAVALNLARQLAAQQNSVFYFNLETIPSVNPLFGGPDNSELSEVLYYLRNNHRQLAAKMESIKNRNSQLKFDYLIPLTHRKETEEINKEDIIKFIDFIAASCSYDFIIADLESTENERVKGALQSSDRIVWLMLDDFICLQKTNHILANWKSSEDESEREFVSKCLFVLNKYTGLVANADTNYEHIQIEQYLPYIPEWKSLRDYNQLFGAKVFNEHLFRWSELFTMEAK